MDISTRSPVRRQQAVLTLSPLAGLYVRLSLGAFSLILALMASVAALAHGDQSPPNPFSDYADVFPGHRLSGAVDRRFSCNAVHQQHDAGCGFSPRGGAFSYIQLSIVEHRVSQVTFSVRPKALQVGDLPLEWGRPLVRYAQSANLYWPELGIHALAWSPDGHFSYHMALLHITFTDKRALSRVAAAYGPRNWATAGFGV